MVGDRGLRCQAGPALRGAWRARRQAGPEAGGVALDALMPISPGLEERWKYWVPQPMPADAIARALDEWRAQLPFVVELSVIEGAKAYRRGGAS